MRSHKQLAYLKMGTEPTNPFAEQDWPLEPCAGDQHTDDQGRLWTCHPIAYGARGGRWAYRQQTSGVVVDTRQHLHSPTFVGMLALPWDGLTKLGWVLAKVYCQPVREKLVPEPPEATRFERLPEPPSEED